jgi:hypothetical protein
MNNTNALNVSRRTVSRGQIVSVKRTIQGVEQVIEFDTRLACKISNRIAADSAKTIWARNPFYSCTAR